MIISDKFKFIFVKIPKNASTSMEEALLKLDPEATVGDNSTPPFGHETMGSIKKVAGEDRWNEYFKFGFVRNPERRFVSHYVYNCDYHYRNNPNVAWVFDETGNFPAPEDKIITREMFMQFHFFDKFWSKPYLKYQQVEWMEDDMWLGVVENMEEDWKYVCERIGETIPLYKSNTTNSKIWSLGDEAKKVFEILYEEDIKMYNDRIAYGVGLK